MAIVRWIFFGALVALASCVPMERVAEAEQAAKVEIAPEVQHEDPAKIVEGTNHVEVEAGEAVKDKVEAKEKVEQVVEQAEQNKSNAAIVEEGHNAEVEHVAQAEQNKTNTVIVEEGHNEEPTAKAVEEHVDIAAAAHEPEHHEDVAAKEQEPLHHDVAAPENAHAEGKDDITAEESKPEPVIEREHEGAAVVSHHEKAFAPEDLEPVLLEHDELLYTDEAVEWDGYEQPGEEKEAESDFDAEYERYLFEMTQEMLQNPELREEIVKEYHDMIDDPETKEDIDKEEKDLYKIALSLFDDHARSKLEEQEREIINRQRRGLHGKNMHDQHIKRTARDFEFHDPDDFLWNDDELDKKHIDRFEEIAKNRATFLNTLDEARKKAFVEHEMARLLHYREMVQAATDPKVKAKLVEAHKAEQDALRAVKGHEPGNEQQLQEAWEADGFDRDTFDANTMFKMHDLNSDGAWDLKEVEAFMLKEAETLHQQATEEGTADQFIVREETARMRQHVFATFDADGDDLISKKEFMEGTTKGSFKNDNPWLPINAEAEMTPEEIAKFEEHARDVKQRRNAGLPPDMLKIAKRLKNTEQDQQQQEQQQQHHQQKKQQQLKLGADDEIGHPEAHKLEKIADLPVLNADEQHL